MDIASYRRNMAFSVHFICESFSWYLRWIKYEKTWQRKKVNKNERKSRTYLSNLQRIIYFNAKFFYFLFFSFSNLMVLIYFGVFQHFVAGVLLPKRYSQRFRKVLKKMSVLESLFNQVVSLRACKFIKKESPAQVLSCEFYKIFKNVYFVEHLPTAASELEILVQNEEKSLLISNNEKYKQRQFPFKSVLLIENSLFCYTRKTGFQKFVGFIRPNEDIFTFTWLRIGEWYGWEFAVVLRKLCIRLSKNC